MTWWIIGAVTVAALLAVIGTAVVLRKLFAVLPRPETFAEGQRLVFGWLASFAGIFCGACAIAMIALLMWGGWSAKEEHTIVVIFGWTLGGFVSAMMVVIIGLLVGGPVGRFSGKVGKDGLQFESGKGDHPPEKMTVTAEMTKGE